MVGMGLVFLEEVNRRCALLLVMLLPALFGVRRLQAQSYSLRLLQSDGDDTSLIKELHPPAGFREQNEAFDYLRGIVPQLQEAGYLGASVDSITVLPDGYVAQVFMGRKWRWARLSLSQLPPALLANTGITEAQFSGRPLTPVALGRLTERILRWYENNGYPFARVGLDSLSEDSAGGISALLRTDPGALRHIDSIIVEGDVRLDKAYLMRYLDLREGSIYNESAIRKIAARLHDLPFLSEGSSASIVFRSIDTKLHLFLRERRINQLNGIIGLQPNTLETGKFLLTLDAAAAFRNLFGKGEAFSCSFQNLQPQSPRIKAEASVPYILGSAIGADGQFDLYFRAQQYRRITYDVGGTYALSVQDGLRLYYRGYSNRIITPDTAYIRSYHRLPDNIDCTSAGGGLQLNTIRVDNRLAPSRGWSARLSGELLQRIIRKNDGITGITDGTSFDFTHLYDTLAAQTNQYRLSGDAAWYIPLRKRVVLKTAYSGGWISGAQLFQNELYQLGGFRSLRGFDEGSIFANQYHIATVELRLLLTRVSAVYLFSDNAWIQTRINGFTAQGLYNGFGAGTNLERKTGVFTIAYGLGRSPENPLQLRQSKIHIGYVAYF